MFRLLCLCAAALLVQGQGSRYSTDPREAAILSEERYLSGDGTFGAAYTQEDGVDFKEESDASGNRKGSYSYVDPSGARRTVHYTAGKNGFVATGDHIPVPPPQPPAVVPDPRYNSPPQQSSQSRGSPNEDDGQYYPELYDNENSVRPQYSAQPRYNPAPAPAQPQYQAPQPQQPRYSGVQQPSYSAPQPQPQSQPRYSGVPQQYSGPQQFSGAPAPAPRPQQLFTPEDRTEPPARFFPPGKLDLNRSPDGYSYSFSSKY